MKQITLSTWERVQLFGVLAQQKGPAGRLRNIWKLMDIIEPAEDEKEELGWQEPAEGQVILLPEHFDTERELEFTPNQFKMLSGLVANFQEWRAGGVSGGDRRRLARLFDKLEVG